MEIRIINSKCQVVNVSDIRIIEADGRYVVGVEGSGKRVMIEGCLDEIESKRIMERIIREIEEGIEGRREGIIIDVRGREGDGE